MNKAVHQCNLIISSQLNSLTRDCVCTHAACAGKEAGEGAADVFRDMGAQHGLDLQPVPVVDGQLDL
jgi:hypothetical protein